MQRIVIIAILAATLGACSSNMMADEPDVTLNSHNSAQAIRDCLVRSNPGATNTTPYQGGWLVSQSFSGIVGGPTTVWMVTITPASSGSHIEARISNRANYNNDVKPCL